MGRAAPAVYGPSKAPCNRFIRWSRIGVFDRVFATLAGESAATETVMIDATRLQAHRTAARLLKKGFPAGNRPTGSVSGPPAIPAASGAPEAA